MNEEALVTLAQLKNALTKGPVLVLPDMNKLFIMETDATGFGFGFGIRCCTNAGESPLKHPYIAHSVGCGFHGHCG